MKRILVIFLGLGLVLSTVSPTFAQGTKTHKHKGGHHGGTRSGPKN
jgi:hypothetical protein